MIEAAEVCLGNGLNPTITSDFLTLETQRFSIKLAERVESRLLRLLRERMHFKGETYHNIVENGLIKPDIYMVDPEQVSDFVRSQGVGDLRDDLDIRVIAYNLPPILEHYWSSKRKKGCPEEKLVKSISQPEKVCASVGKITKTAIRAYNFNRTIRVLRINERGHHQGDFYYLYGVIPWTDSIPEELTFGRKYLLAS